MYICKHFCAYEVQHGDGHKATNCGGSGICITRCLDLSFLEDNLRHNPVRITPLSETEASRLERLVDGIETDAEIAPDVTF